MKIKKNIFVGTTRDDLSAKLFNTPLPTLARSVSYCARSTLPYSFTTSDQMLNLLVYLHVYKMDATKSRDNKTRKYVTQILYVWEYRFKLWTNFRLHTFPFA